MLNLKQNCPLALEHFALRAFVDEAEPRTAQDLQGFQIDIHNRPARITGRTTFDFVFQHRLDRLAPPMKDICFARHDDRT